MSQRDAYHETTLEGLRREVKDAEAALVVLEHRCHEARERRLAARKALAVARERIREERA